VSGEDVEISSVTLLAWIATGMIYQVIMKPPIPRKFTFDNFQSAEQILISLQENSTINCRTIWILLRLV